MRKVTLSILTLFLVINFAFGLSITFAQNFNIFYRAQEKLSDLGFDPGPIDGKWGNKTEEAIKRFQKREGLRQTGQLDESTMKALGLVGEKPEKAPEIYDQGKQANQISDVPQNHDQPVTDTEKSALKELISLFFDKLYNLFVISFILFSIPVIIVLAINYLFFVKKQKLLMSISRDIMNELQELMSIIRKQTSLIYNELSLTSSFNRLIRSLEKHDEELSTLLYTLKEKAANLTSIRLQEEVASPQVIELDESVTIYNQILKKEAMPEEFISRFKPINVSMEESPELNQGIFANGEYKPRFRTNSVGRLLIIKHADPEQYFLFPSFDPFDLSPRITMNFEIIKTGYSIRSGSKLQEVGRSALCRRISEDQWELVQKGELYMQT